MIFAGVLLSMLIVQNPQACPFTTDEFHSIIPGPECTMDKMLKDFNGGDFRPVITNPGVGQAICPGNFDPPLPPEVLGDMAVDPLGVPRPNRPPNSLFPGDTGCDIGAFQFVDFPAPTVVIKVTPH